MSDKTVFILGAGASKTANLPNQAEILPLIFSIRPGDRVDISAADDFLSLDLDDRAEKVREFYPIFDQDRQELGDFILTNFASADKLNQYRMAIRYANSLKEIDVETVNQRMDFLFKAYEVAKSVNVSLEDLFTIFDNVAAGREHFRLYSPEKMGVMHKNLKLCIIYALVHSSTIDCDDFQYRRFSQYLLNTRVAASQKDDIIAVITMNWDDIFEKTLYSLCCEYNERRGKGKQQHVLLDLCFYNYDLSLSTDHMPSTHIKARGQKNVKVLKMHGSLGWLECPKCGRIYTDFNNEIAAEEYSGMICPYCKSGDMMVGEDPVLRSLIITPTFMKSLDNLNIKNIWHNAYIDVSEADHLVFIGYSFPEADFEMRCLLKKAVKNDADITVVLNDSNDPEKYSESFKANGYSAEDTKNLIGRMWLPEERYKTFFGEDKVKFYYKGFQGYLDDIGG